jgi:hypothetical protein
LSEEIVAWFGEREGEDQHGERDPDLQQREAIVRAMASC